MFHFFYNTVFRNCLNAFLLSRFLAVSEKPQNYLLFALKFSLFRFSARLHEYLEDASGLKQETKTG